MDTNKARMMIPYSGGPKRLAFQIRRFRIHGSTSLLITNRFGVWSTVRRRHVKKTRYLRFHKLKRVAGQLESCYVSLRNLGAKDERVTSCRRRLADFYWDAAPASYRADAIDYLRVAKWKKWLLLLVYHLIALLQGMLFFHQKNIEEEEAKKKVVVYVEENVSALSPSSN